MLSAMPPAPAASDSVGAVTLITGPEEFLAERSVRAVVDAVRAVDGDADVTEVVGADVGADALAELTSPSLFASSRAVVVRQIQDLSQRAGEAIVRYCDRPDPDVALVLVHPGGQKGRGLVDQLRKADTVEISCEAMKPYDLPRFVATEIRRHRGVIDEEAARLLVDAVGADLRALAAAASQLSNDFAPEPISAEVVGRYFGGRAEVKGFAVADAALGGRSADALEQLRWALGNGVAPVLLTSAFAGGLRGLARLVSAPRGLREADLAREVGVPPWKLKTLRAQSRGWHPIGLATAITAVARADADVKGAADDAGHALERMVLAVSEARSAG